MRSHEMLRSDGIVAAISAYTSDTWLYFQSRPMRCASSTISSQSGRASPGNSSAGRPICTVVADGATPEDVMFKLEEQAATLRAELRQREKVAAHG